MQKSTIFNVMKDFERFVTDDERFNDMNFFGLTI